MTWTWLIRKLVGKDSLIVWMGILCTMSWSGIQGQSRKAIAVNSSLFREDAMLEMVLTMNIEEVIKDVVEREDHPAILQYAIASGDTVSIDLKVKTRGNNRANPVVCTFPPLQLNFKKKGNYDNLFAGQDKIKLVTHCKKAQIFEDYLVREHLTYELYNVLTEHSFLSRLVRVTYKDAGTSRPYITRYGIIIEEDEVMAWRNGKTQHKEEVKTQDVCVREGLDLMTVFQYMIGNTDWSVAALHNIKLVIDKKSRKPPTPVPYDFDYAGIVSAHYASPHESLPIKSVRDRLFRGFCRLPGQYEEVFGLFEGKRSALYQVIDKSHHLSERARKDVVRYMDDFYETIGNEKKARREIIEACRIDHPHLYQD